MNGVKMLKNGVRALLGRKDIVFNWLNSDAFDLTYVVDSGAWSVGEVGHGLCHSLTAQKMMKARVSQSFRFVRSKICHFGGQCVAYGWLNRGRPRCSEAKVLTLFHIVPGHPENALVFSNLRRFSHIHTTCKKTKEELMTMGLDEKYIDIIPLGIDPRILTVDFRRCRLELRHRLGVHDGVCIIGSFQKDGLGWEEGFRPKLIKGPDVFAGVVEQVARKRKIHVLLSGPARGYVMHRLRSAGVPFTYLGFFKDYRDIWPWYSALDMYLITSRIEGGPFAILEAWASGVPVVSTRVGMVPDIATDRESALLAEVEDRSTLARYALEVMENADLRRKLVESGKREVCKYTIDVIAQRYYHELYKELL